MSQDWQGREESLDRFSRIEGSIATLASQAFCAQSDTAATLIDIKNLLLSLVNSGSSSQRQPIQPMSPKPPQSNRNRGATGMSPTGVTPQQILCTFCNASQRRCTATSSLRHMLACEHCPPGTCRYIAISSHMYAFKSAPLLGSPDRCCWCGNGWDNCSSVSSERHPSLSPDARSKHKKVCHDKVHQALQSDAKTIHDTKGVLDELWSMACADPLKRGRDQESSDGQNGASGTEGFAALDAFPTYASGADSGADLVSGFPASSDTDVQ